MIDRNRLINELMALAKRVGTRRYFWEEFAERLLNGEVKCLDIKTHYKHPKTIDEIAQDIHRALWKDVDYDKIEKPDKLTYYRIIRIVKEGLDY